MTINEQKEKHQFSVSLSKHADNRSEFSKTKNELKPKVSKAEIQSVYWLSAEPPVTWEWYV